MYDVATGQTTQIAQHDAPVKAIKWIDNPGSGILATGSWDKTIKVRDALWWTPSVGRSREHSAEAGVYSHSLPESAAPSGFLVP